MQVAEQRAILLPAQWMDAAKGYMLLERKRIVREHGGRIGFALQSGVAIVCYIGRSFPRGQSWGQTAAQVCRQWGQTNMYRTDKEDSS
ncbi:MAG: hypothetical protein D8M22_05825 [Armatimonadetes bacterium]|nr:hypothetical protein [Armatimonadota bacterium]